MSFEVDPKVGMIAEAYAADAEDFAKTACRKDGRLSGRFLPLGRNRRAQRLPHRSSKSPIVPSIPCNALFLHEMVSSHLLE